MGAKEPVRKPRGFWKDQIWRLEDPSDHSFRARWYGFLRVVSITATGLWNSKVTSRAAALSFSTLLSLGPLIAIAVLVAGFALNKNDPQLVTKQVDHFIRFIAPQVARLEHLDTQPEGSTLAVNPGVIDFINNSINGVSSGTAGTLSVLTLVLIVLTLFSSIEDAFNEIWGVRRGRALMLRIVLYWTVLTLGAVILFAAVGALSAATFMNFFHDRLLMLPMGERLVAFMRFSLPTLSMFLIIGVLTLFYRYIPNTRVHWRSAAIGATLVAAMLLVNNLLAFAYFKRIDLTRSLYGSLSFVPIFMLGLYVFWLIILIGGQISYAVQNARYLNSRAVWSQLTEADREGLTLAVLLTLGRRFQDCLPAASLSDLARCIPVPSQFLNEALNQLVDFGFVSALPSPAQDGITDACYQPSRPLDRITLGEFNRRFQNHGESASTARIETTDPVAALYRKSLEASVQSPLFETSLRELFLAHPVPPMPPKA